MASLYEIDKAIEEFFDSHIDPETGEILGYEELEELQMERKQKCENIGLYIKNLSAEAEMVKKERDSLAKRQKTLENKVESLKNYLAYALGGEKFSTPRLVVSYRRSESVNIVDELKVPDEYCHFSVDRKPDKKMLKDALKHGKEIEGVSIVEKQSVQIR